LSSAFLIVLGGGLFSVGIHWFRDTGVVTEKLAGDSERVANVIAPETVSAAEPILFRADMISVIDGKSTGVANRTPGTSSADFHLISYLPGIDGTQEVYAVWLLKDGLADVKRMGELLPRADGSWVADFTAGALSGIADPDAYRTLVIMKEKIGVKDEKGTKIAEAKF